MTTPEQIGAIEQSIEQYFDGVREDYETALKEAYMKSSSGNRQSQKAHWIFFGCRNRGGSRELRVCRSR